MDGNIISRPFFMRTKSAFTIVELIVVVSVLAILGTIAFLSFSGYSSSARDSVRLADLSNLVKGMEMAVNKGGTLPKPSGSVDIKAGAITIGYQGYADKTVLGILGMSDAKDPLDANVYYTYTTDVDQSKYQVLGFLESADTISYSPINQVYAEPATYANRFPVTKGKTLGVLLDSTTLLPIQAKTGVTFLDTTSAASSSGYIAQFTNSDRLVSTGGATPLFSIMTAYQPKTLSQYDTNLVGYWDMETVIKGTIKDLSQYGDDGTLVGGVIANTALNGRQGASFNGTNGYVTFPTNSILGIANAITISTWINPSSSIGSLNRIYTGNNNGFGTDGINTAWFYIGGGFRYSQNPSSYVTLNSWNHWTVSYDIVTQKIKIYINGKLVGTTSLTGLSDYHVQINSNQLYLGTYDTVQSWSFFPGSIDDFRIYNRALSDSEIAALYNATK